MHNWRQHRLSLLELILAMSLLSAIATAAVPILLMMLRIEAETGAQLHTTQTGQYILQRIEADLCCSTGIIRPSQMSADSSRLEFVALVNDDADYHFDDPLFPRANEDPRGDKNNDGAPGIAGLDDDGDGQIDEGHPDDDDEDGQVDEDPEDVLTFNFNAGQATLTETYSGGPTVVLARPVSDFRVRRLTANQIQLTLTLRDANSRPQTFVQVVHLRNISQNTGVLLQ